ncbi:DNA sulfur modification protein DndE [Chamaesiphon sp. VAR_48_metabat_135_sub]|uniref:DNA sulfur modification protein DndE n=1 Tax=Chamaesiphon sp. VAR_48_metabat_135_sub TaxID=2964699 RepID=UPI00286AB401|nr:DNA sulfur modification protein DndE [Chamaesiphon sp. VAR_48_metabat_135_sub]
MIEPPVNSIKLSQTAKEQLMKLKRSTKIEQWNILCRWAFFRSLAETAPPSLVPIPADSNLEMTWRVFGGELADLSILALRQRCHQDGLEITPEILSQQFRLHLHRGIGYLSGDASIRKIEDLVSLAVPNHNSPTHD